MQEHARLIITLPPLTGKPQEQAISARLQRHGCSIEASQSACKVIFPEGTKREFHLRLTRTDSYWLMLPDGFVLRELVVSSIPGREEHALVVPDEPATALHPSEKPTFRDLYYRHNLSFAALAQAAGVSPLIPSFLFEGRPVPRREAERLLAVLSQIVHEHYTLETVEVNVLGDARC